MQAGSQAIVPLPGRVVELDGVLNGPALKFPQTKPFSLIDLVSIGLALGMAGAIEP